ncbi:neuropeptide-like 1 isoform X1 [Musca domestica]|uniref:Neuropeptide-like 1 isoform X1 n=3 Tax=Musca domestica TaxID=7370 RepID=A0A9J7D7V4_MUSDO|nr:neuropeptide-like 1 isoform X1 [Musca domestica]
MSAMQQLMEQRKLLQQHPLADIKLWLLFGLLLNVAHYPRAVKATDDVANVSPCELESIINQLVNPSPQYQMQVSSLRNQLRNILRERQLDEGEEQSLNNELDYLEEDKRSVAALAAQGLLNLNGSPKRSLATLAKNGQLPTPDPEIVPDEEQRSEDKRYIGSLARSGQMLGYGKRNIGTLARDFQLPNGKRNLATMARLGLLGRNEPKRNMAAVARYNSQRMYNNANNAAEKRNIGALKASPVHGVQQKRGEDEAPVYLPASFDYVDPLAYYWNYGTYADMDWGDFGRAQKRFLDTSKDPELFGIENANFLQTLDSKEAAVGRTGTETAESIDMDSESGAEPIPLTAAESEDSDAYETPSKRHIGAVYRSGFLPSYRALRSPMGSGSGGAVGGGRFSRSGRARQFVEYYPPPERLRQPIAAVCKRCFFPYRPMVNWGAAGMRGRWPLYMQSMEHHRSISTNDLPSAYYPRNLRRQAAVSAPFHSWGTPPRITAMNRRSFRRNDLNNLTRY